MALQVGGVSKIETMKCVLESCGLRPKKGCAGDVQQRKKKTEKLQTRLLVREGAPHQ
jgi:hypothetical protein